MEENIERKYFGIADVIVFVGTLVLSGLIGVYFAVKDRKVKNTENYYYGGKVMHPIPLGISMAVTFISALTVIAVPTEMYVYGLVTLWNAVTLTVATTVSCIYYIPLMHKLQLTTIYQYLELRFNPVLRRLVSASEFVSMLFYMGITVYVPAIALNAVTPISMQWSILLTSGICTLYTTFGGMKAVVWTDVAQAGIMLFGALAALVKAIIVVGGLGEVFKAVERGGRNNLFDFNPDPTIRSTFWTLFVGGSIKMCQNACTNQSIYQRYLSCKTVDGARKAAVAAIPPKILLYSIAILSGCAAYTYFEGCDPLGSGKISKKDQMMPYLVLIVFRETPGMAGFFVAAAYSGTMSTVSSGINSLSAQLLEDFVVPRRPNLSNVAKLAIGKVTVFLLGVTVTILAYGASLTSGTVLSMVIAIRGAFAGPILGVFTLGVFLPWTNTKGAIAGHLISTVIMVWIGLGGLLSGRSPETQRVLPTSIDRCSDYNITNINADVTPASYMTANMSTVAQPTAKYYNPFYAISLMYTAAMGLILTVVIGLLVSFITGAQNPKNLDAKLFSPIFDNNAFPEKFRQFFRLGVPEKSLSTFDNSKTSSLNLHYTDKNEKTQELEIASLTKSTPD